MGCDIHLAVEQRQADGTWQRAEDVIENKWYDPEEPDDGPPTERDRWYSDRNYDLFGVLANVRNGVGFAGCDLGDGFVPIHQPRGVPDDASDEYREWVKTWEGDGHSHSWATVAELLEYDWDQTTKHRCLVNDFGAERFGKTPTDDRWKDGGFAAYVQQYANEHDGELPEGTSTCGGVFGAGAEQYKQIEYSIVYRTAMGEVWWEFVDRLKELAADDPAAVRICYFFDN